MSTRNLQLFFICVAIWGTTWLAIKFQLGIVPPEVSVAWRFGLAAALLAGFCVWRGDTLRFSFAQHRTLFLLGVLMFGISYVFVYIAEQYVVSALVAVGYSASPLLNMLISRVAHGTPMSRRVAVGGLLGVLGIVLIFWPEFTASLTAQHLSREFILGVSFTAAAVVIAAIANVYATRANEQGINVWQKMAWGMGYGAVCCLVWALAAGKPLTFDFRLPYVASLLYLAVFGSILAFAGYLTLMNHVGAARAGYIGVMVPIVALIISSIFENYDWTLLAVAGIALATAGNVLVLRAPGRPDATPRRAEQA
jgi:drug/metabolite transporter (DMT)-like permease